jgi:hypothetical protein
MKEKIMKQTNIKETKYFFISYSFQSDERGMGVGQTVHRIDDYRYFPILACNKVIERGCLERDGIRGKAVILNFFEVSQATFDDFHSGLIVERAKQKLDDVRISDEEKKAKRKIADLKSSITSNLDKKSAGKAIELLDKLLANID